MYVAAAAAGSEFCTKTYAQRVLKAGVTAEEVAEALLVARFASAAIVFATAVPTMEFLLEQRDHE